MPMKHRRLQSLNLEAETQENVEQHEDVQDPQPELTIGFPEGEAPTRNKSFKIIWQNGVVREVFRNFRTAELWDLKGGRVLVETDKNGIPNQWSESILSSYLGELAQNSSFAPLHIPRWDNKLFKGPKERIIKDVEKKFIYSSETKWSTRDWILKTVNKRWRDYKSDLKKQYFNPDKRSFDQIEKDVPDGVNENQWSFLLGIWCSEAHQKLCRTNAESGKKQRHPHTSGRKSHARLKKEMVMALSEDKKKGSITKIDLWDESHKKRNGNYVNQNVQTLMGKAFDELENRRKDKGTLSTSDYDDVFENVIRKDLNIRGKKFPEEELLSTILATGSGSTTVDTKDNENVSLQYDNVERSSYEKSPSPYNEQIYTRDYNIAKVGCSDHSVPNDNIAFRESQVTRSSDLNQELNNGSLSLDKEMSDKETQSKQQQQSKLQQNKQKTVLLYSTRKRKLGQVFAVGNLISRDTTHEIGGTVLGDGYYAVAVHYLNNVEDERLPRPHGDLKTLEDAVGMCVAWPRTHLKRVKPTTEKRT
ncbi:uncharacterized protein [Zea mays]|uniref:uncharacterized protein n=1 Tax=Zea mays TaxID=4577 RepID=UPI001651CF68|nr:uncharacterized protein LOC103649663 [Zea mays]